MKAKHILIALVLAAGPAVTGAFADTLNLSTGQDSGGNIIGAGGVSDANWTVDPPGTTDPTNQSPVAAQTVFPNNADWFGGWLANDSSSDWIARNADISNNGPAPYSFYYNFSLADTAGASISGSWTIDDSGVLLLNGNLVSALPSGDWGSLNAFSDSNASDFVVGQNVLQIQITSDDQFLEAVRLTGSLNGDLGSATPEPSTCFMLLGGLSLVGAAFRKRVAR